MGFDESARQALFRLRKTWARDLPDVFVTLAGIGALDGFAKTVPLVRASRIFRSATPFVPARFLKAKGKDSLAEQVMRELAFRDLPRATDVSIEVDDGGWVSSSNVITGRRAAGLAVEVGGGLRRPSGRFRHFLRGRADRPPPVAFGLSLRLVFEDRVPGPIALGYGSHFGLGVFEPEQTQGRSDLRSPGVGEHAARP